MASSDAAMDPNRAGGWIERRAPAKLNLCLHVVDRRADGYHLLDSLVAFATIGDRVRVADAPQLAFTVGGRFAADVPSGAAAADNLAVKAARLLATALDRPADVAIDLHKSLPAAAGLGGGSADAAAVLRALAELWGIDDGDIRLRDIAGQLGADVPVCLVSRTSRVRGIGDRVEPAPSLSGVPVLLANPLVPVSTPEVFRSLAGPFSDSPEFSAPPRDPADLAVWLGQRSNDLQMPAQRLLPTIGEVIEALSAEAGCLLARMSGSGATCFGLFKSVGEAERAGRRLSSGRPGWWVRTGQLL